MAELARRGIEYMLDVYAPQDAGSDWHLPTPRHLGWKGLSDAELKAAAQQSATEMQLAGEDVD